MDFQTAASRGNLDAIKTMLVAGTFIHKNWHMTRSPLCLAAGNGHTKVVKLLTEEGRFDPDEIDSTGRTPLSWAAGRGHKGVVSLLIASKDVDINSQDDNGSTPLSWAAGTGHANIVKLLLEKNANINLQDRDGQTPLLWAAVEGHTEVVKLLLRQPDVNIKQGDKKKRTPLIWAALKGRKEHIDILRMIMEHTQDSMHYPDRDGRTALSWAAAHGHERVVKILLEKEDYARQMDNEGRTPLSWAAEEGHKVVVEMILHADRKLHNVSVLGPGGTKIHPITRSVVDISSTDGRTSLHLAARCGHDKVVKVLLATSRANLNAQDQTERTPLSWAAEHGHHAVVNLLLAESGIDTNMADKDGRTPLDWAASEGHRIVVSSLLKHTRILVRPNIPGNDGLHKPMLLAAEKGRLAVVKLLLESDDAIKDARDRNKTSVLMKAAGAGHEKMINLLLERGALADQSEKTSEKMTLLMWAARGGNHALVLRFINLGADWKEQDRNECTLLMWAARGGNDESVAFFLRKGLDIEARDRSGKTALMWAANNGHEKAVKMLIKHGANIEAKVKSRLGDFTAWRYAELQGYRGVQRLLETAIRDRRFTTQPSSTASSASPNQMDRQNKPPLPNIAGPAVTLQAPQRPQTPPAVQPLTLPQRHGPPSQIPLNSVTPTPLSASTQASTTQILSKRTPLTQTPPPQTPQPLAPPITVAQNAGAFDQNASALGLGPQVPTTLTNTMPISRTNMSLYQGVPMRSQAA